MTPSFGYFGGLPYNFPPKKPTKWLWIALAILVGILFYTAARAEGIVDLSIIAKIESSGNPLAYNRHSQARGLYQITPICLKDYNLVNRVNLSKEALFSPTEARKVADWYIDVRIPQMLKHYIKNYSSIKNIDLYIIACYNWGIGNIVKWHKQGATFNKLPKETQNYWRKYVALNKS